MERKFNFRKVWNVIKLFLAIILIVIVSSQTNLQQIIILKNDIVWGWFLLHILSFVVMTFVKAYQYHLLIGIRTNYKDVVRIVIWQNAISNFIATSAGIVSYMGMLKAEQNVKLSRSGVIFLITKFGDLLVICLYLGISAGLVWNQIQTLQILTMLLISGILFGVAIFLITIVLREHFVNSMARALAYLKLDHFLWVSRGIEMLQSLALEERGTISKMLRTGILLSLVYMTVTMISAITGIWMFGVHLGVAPLIYVASLMQLISFVPIQVLGGLGVIELTSVYFYSFFGLNQGEMSAVMLGLRAVFYLMNAAMLLYLPISALLKSPKRIDSPN